MKHLQKLFSIIAVTILVSVPFGLTSAGTPMQPAHEQGAFVPAEIDPRIVAQDGDVSLAVYVDGGVAVAPEHGLLRIVVPSATDALNLRIVPLGTPTKQLSHGSLSISGLKTYSMEPSEAFYVEVFWVILAGLALFILTLPRRHAGQSASSGAGSSAVAATGAR